MKKYIFCSHGLLCDGMIDTLKIFSLYNKDCTFAVPFYVEGKDSIQLLQKIMTDVKMDDQVFIFTDIVFGSVNQVVMEKYSKCSNVHIIAGFNLMIALEIISHEKYLNSDEIRGFVKSAKESIIYTRDLVVSNNDEDE